MATDGLLLTPDGIATIIAAAIMGVCAVLAALIPIMWSAYNARRAQSSAGKQAGRILLPASHAAPPSPAGRPRAKVVLAFLALGALVGYLLFLAIRQYITPSSNPEATPTVPASPTPTATPIPTITSTSTPTPTPTPTPTTSPTQLAQCAPRGDPLLEEHFDDNSKNWVVDNSLNYPYTIEQRQIRGGSLRYSAYFTEDAIAAIVIPDIDTQDFYLQFTVIVAELPAQGPARIAVQFRRNLGQYYLPRFSSDSTFGLHVMIDEALYEILPFTDTAAFDISVGMPNTFSVTVDGWAISTCANGQSVSRVTNHALPGPGAIGIGMSASKGSTVTLQIDDIIVNELR